MCDVSTAIQALSLLTQAGTTAYGMAQGPAGTAQDGGMKLPTAIPMDPSQAIKQQVPRTQANAAANTGGGFAPDFLANLAASDAGFPGMGMDVLEDLRKQQGAASA